MPWPRAGWASSSPSPESACPFSACTPCSCLTCRPAVGSTTPRQNSDAESLPGSSLPKESFQILDRGFGTRLAVTTHMGITYKTLPLLVAILCVGLLGLACSTRLAPKPDGSVGGAAEGGQTGGIAAGSGGMMSTGGSLGTVTLRLNLPSGVAYCDQSTSCAALSHISLVSEDGGTINTFWPGCMSTACSSACLPSACPVIYCNPQGFPVTNVEMTWNGSYIGDSKCGDNRDCYLTKYLPAGNYVAVMCATPGTLDAPETGTMQTCTPTGARECIRVPFEFPSANIVDGTLP